MSTMLTALIPMRALRLTAAAVLLALAFLRRMVEATQLLSQSVNLAFVGGLLSFRFFEQFQHFIELIERVPQRRDDGHDFVNCLADGCRCRRLSGTGGTVSGLFLVMARLLWSGSLTCRFGGLVGNFHFR